MSHFLSQMIPIDDPPIGMILQYWVQKLPHCITLHSLWERNLKQPVNIPCWPFVQWLTRYLVVCGLKIAFNRQSAIKHLFFKSESTRNYSVVHCIHCMHYTLLMLPLFRRALENGSLMKWKWNDDFYWPARGINSPEYWPGCLIQCRFKLFSCAQSVYCNFVLFWSVLLCVCILSGGVS